MKKLFRIAPISLLLVLTLLLLTSSIAFAARPLGLHMEVYEVIAAEGDVFIASGPAVDAGIICPTGTQDNLVINEFGPPEGDFRILYIYKVFTWGDGSGMFGIKMRVKLDLTTGYTTATWYFNGGIGDYHGLRGHGTLVGIPDVPFESILDIYDGTAHLTGRP